MEIRRSVTQLREHLQRLLRSPSDELDRTGRFLVYQIRLWWFCGRKLVKDRLLVTASALSWKTLLSLIPILILVAMIYQVVIPGEQTRQRVQEAILNLPIFPDEAEQATEIKQWLGEAMDKGAAAITAEGAGAGTSVTIISVILFFWAGMSVFGTIEGAMNYIWEVRQGRSYFARFRAFLTTIVLVTLFLGVTFYLSEKIDVTAIAGVPTGALPLLGTLLVLFIIYKTVPNVRVANRAALTAALVGALLWEFGAKLGFLQYLQYATGARKLYGVLAVIPVFMLWIWISWVIILFGAELAYVIQHITALARDQMERDAHRRFIRADLVALGIASVVGRRFSQGVEPPTSRQLSDALGLSEGDVGEVAEAMCQRGLLRVTSANRNDAGYVPTRPLDQITAADILAAGDGMSLSPQTDGHRGAVMRWAGQYMKEVSQNVQSALREETLASLVRRAEATVLGKPGDSRQ